MKNLIANLFIPLFMVCFLSAPAFAMAAEEKSLERRYLDSPLKQIFKKGGETAKKGEEGFKEQMKKMTVEQRGIREKAIEDAATTWAFQTAVKWQYDRIVQYLEANEASSSLDHTFDFRIFLIQGKLLPPIIATADSSFTVKTGGVAVSTARTYRLVSEAKIVASPPGWRDYLIKHYKAVDQINPLLLPRSKKELEGWKTVILSSFNEGVSHAWYLFKLGLVRLTRDYLGLNTYVWLRDSNILTAPYMSEGRFAVALSDKGRAIDFNRRVFRITQRPVFNERTDTYRPPGVFEHLKATDADDFRPYHHRKDFRR